MSKGTDQPRGGNVYEFQPSQQRSATIDKIESHWQSVRGNRLVPSRCEINPRGLEGVLGHAFILERITGGLARFRIAGSHLCELTGLELRQMPISALFLPNARSLLSDALYSVFDEPAVVRMTIASPAGFGRDRLEGEMILLPLRSDLGDIDRVLGGLVLHGQVGRTPRRIDIMQETRESMTGYAGAVPFEQPRVPGVERVERPASVAKPAKIERGHLRLVVVND